MNRRLRLALWIGAGLLVPGLCVVLAVLFPRMTSPAPVRDPFPGAILLTQTVQPSWPGRLSVIRHYRAAGSYRSVVTWYQGKDSLLPLAAFVGPSCFQQSFRQNPGRVARLLQIRIEEDVTVCSSPNGPMITSITTVHTPALVPRVTPTN